MRRSAMRWTLLVATLAGGCYGDGEGVYVSDASYEAQARCLPERCALALGASAALSVNHWVSDVEGPATIASVAVDRPDVVEVVADPAGLRVRGLAVGRARLTVTVPAYQGEPLEAIADLVVAEPRLRIAPRDGDAAPDQDVLRVLVGSALELRLDRVDADGLPLLGDNPAPWTIDGEAATLAPLGETGLLQTLTVPALERVTVATGGAARAVELVQASSIATLRVHVRERPALVAGDGETLRLRERAHFAFVIDALDGAGRYVDGAGADVIAIASPYLRTVSPARARWFSVEPVDQEVRLSLGAATARVVLDFP